MKDIPTDGHYDGYVWMSNATQPIVLHDTRLPFALDSRNPFVAEAQLFDRATQCSYSVRNVGNEIICTVANIADENETKTNHVFLSTGDSLKGLRLRFCDIWERRADEKCLGMERLTIVGRAFIGFENENEEDKA